MPNLKSLSLLACAALVSGCAQELEPRVLAFDYDVETYTPSTRSGIIGNLSSGAAPVSAYLPSNSCAFVADFSGTRSNTRFNGDPGQSGFNVELVSASANNISTANPASCPDIEAFNFKAGDNSAIWGPGLSTDESEFSGEIDGEGFDSQYFRANMHTAPNNNYITGDFEFVATTASGQTIIGSGLFNIRD